VELVPDLSTISDYQDEEGLPRRQQPQIAQSVDCDESFDCDPIFYGNIPERFGRVTAQA
jgi:hypothetical protein